MKDAEQNNGPGRNRARGHHRTSTAPAYAALDLGTNNCRMLIAEPVGAGPDKRSDKRSASRRHHQRRYDSNRQNGFRVVGSFSRTVRLGEGISRSGALSHEAMERTIEALRICADKMDAAGVKRSRAVATEACRRVANGEEFVARVAEETGIEFEIIDFMEEARLTLSGCQALLNDHRPRALVFDIGGGSTELTWVRLHEDGGPKIEDVLSIPVGVVTLSEDWGEDAVKGPIGEDLFEQAVRSVIHELDTFCAKNGVGACVDRREVQMLGTSGTVTTLGALDLGLNHYMRSRVDGRLLKFDSIRHISNWLASLPVEKRAEVNCIGTERADLVVAGCAILEAICRRWPVGRLRVADRGIREGLLKSMIDADRQERHAATSA